MRDFTEALAITLTDQTVLTTQSKKKLNARFYSGRPHSLTDQTLTHRVKKLNARFL